MTPNEWIENASQGHNLVMALTVFVLACFVGYYVVWRVTPALHSPLMAVTNAVSSIIIVGALLAISGSVPLSMQMPDLEGGPSLFKDGSPPLFTQITGFIAIMLASVNIFGGFVITARMLSKFRSKSNINRKKS